jgi:hypothetical protein
MSPAAVPKVAGASVTAQGELSWPRLANLCSRSPLVLNTSTNPLPGPATSSCFDVVLLGECDEQPAADVVDAERREAGGDARVGEGFDQVEVAVEHFDLAEAEVRCVEELASGGGRQGKAFVDGADVAYRVGDARAVDGDDGVRPINGRVPAEKCAVLGGEEESAGPR